MLSGAIVVIGVSAKQMPKMPLAKYHDMVKAFPVGSTQSASHNSHSAMATNTASFANAAHNPNNRITVGALIQVNAPSPTTAAQTTKPPAKWETRRLCLVAPSVPFSWTAVVELSKPGSEVVGNFTSVPPFRSAKGGRPSPTRGE